MRNRAFGLQGKASLELLMKFLDLADESAGLPTIHTVSIYNNLVLSCLDRRLKWSLYDAGAGRSDQSAD